MRCAGRPHQSIASTSYAQSQPSAITWTAGGKQSKNVDVLFVQNAKNVTINKGRLILRGVNPVTVCFTDRPARLAGHMLTSKFVPLWSQGKDSFLKDNPNATLSVFDGDKVSDLVVELSNPQLSGNYLSYSCEGARRHVVSARRSLRALHRYHRHAADAVFFRWCRTAGLPPRLLLNVRYFSSIHGWQNNALVSTLHGAAST